MNWQLVLILYFAVATASSLQRRVFAQKTSLHPAVASLFAHSLIIFPLGIIWAVLEKNWFPSGVNVTLMLAMIAAALFQSFFNNFSLKSQQKVDATQFSIIGNLYTPITIIGSAIYLNEGLTAVQTVGMILLVLGAVVVSVRGFSKKTLNLTKYSWLALLSALVLGVAVIAERSAIKGSSIGSYFVVGYAIQSVFQLIIAWPYLKKNFIYNKQETSGLIWMGVLRFGQFSTFALASVLAANVSLISSVTTFKIVFIFGASFFILKEKDHLGRKIIGVVLSLIGLLLS